MLPPQVQGQKPPQLQQAEQAIQQLQGQVQQLNQQLNDKNNEMQLKAQENQIRGQEAQTKQFQAETDRQHKLMMPQQQPDNSVVVEQMKQAGAQQLQAQKTQAAAGLKVLDAHVTPQQQPIKEM